MFDALVAVMRGRHETQGPTVAEGQGLLVQGGGEQDVIGEQVVQAGLIAVPVLAVEGQESSHSGRVHAGTDDLLVDAPKRHACPTEVEAGPGGHTVKVGSLLARG